MVISKASAFAVMVALGVALTGAVAARQADPGVQLRAAIEKEEVTGDLDGAMALYRQIIAADGRNRAVTARAMLRLAGCYEKLGQTEARKLYERLIAEYPDQAAEATSARQKLAALAALAKSAEPQKPTFRQIRIPTKLPANGSGKLSPDGQSLAYIEGGSLWTVPVHGKSDPNIAGAPTRLTEPMHAWDSANICVEWSADGKWIGFIVEPPQSGKDGTPVEELYVVPAAGGTPRRVQARSETWSGGGHTLRYALSAGADVLYFAAGKEMGDLRIYGMSTRGGEPRPVTVPITREPALSPDGSRIAYVKGEDLGRNFFGSKEVWVASIDGSAARLAYRLRDESQETGVLRPDLVTRREDARIPDPHAPARVHPGVGASGARQRRAGTGAGIIRSAGRAGRDGQSPGGLDEGQPDRCPHSSRGAVGPLHDTSRGRQGPPADSQVGRVARLDA